MTPKPPSVKSLVEETLFTQMKLRQLPLPSREVKFHPERKWRLDFAWEDLKLAVEVEGGTTSHGRHTRPLGYEEDCRKYNAAALSGGYTVLRVTSRMVSSGEAITLVEEALQQFLKK